MLTSEVLKADITTNPFYVYIPANNSSYKNALIQIDQLLVETTLSNFPSYLKLHYEGSAFYDFTRNKSTEFEMIPKTNIWGSIVQFYKEGDENSEHIAIGLQNSILLVLTDQFDTPIKPSEYSLLHLSIKVIFL